MAKKKATKPETKSDFLRRVLSRNPNLEYKQICQRWAKAGHPGTISNALYYQVRAKLGIRTVWQWVKEDEPAPGGPAASGATGAVYQFKVTLLGVKPPVWRRVQVPDGTLDDLHSVIQVAMGWHNSHMHQFIIDGDYYGAVTVGELDVEDEEAVRLSRLLAGKKTYRFGYEYDFGDSWEHEVVFEKAVEREPKVKYPYCVDGARACPPEDCGGVWGYADFLEAMADPKHPSHRDMKEWYGVKFDPEKFSAEAVNRELRRYF
jgi:hypothetical protein